MSWQATSWAARQDCGGVGGKCLLYALANYADMAGRTWASQQRLCADTEMKERALRDWLHELERRDLIIITQRRRPDGTRKADVITLNMGPEAGPQDGYEGPDEPDSPPPQPAESAGCTTGKKRQDNRQIPTDQPADSAASIENSQEEQSKEEQEREGACARDEKTERRRLRKEFLKRYPTANVDSHVSFDREWDLVPDGDLQAAVDGIEPYLAELKRHKRAHPLSMASYVHERKWVGLPPIDTAPPPSSVVFRVWSREWWAMLLAKIDRGEAVSFTVKHALSPGTRDVSERVERMPPTEVIAGLKGYPGNGPEFANWRPWFAQRGANFPAYREKVWVYLPGPEPPVTGVPALRATGPPAAA